MDVYVFVAFHWFTADNRKARMVQAFDQETQFLYKKAGMRFLGWSKVGVDTKVNSDGCCFKPGTTSLGELRWLWYFGNSK
jgi:hypothetical protein